MTGAPMPAGSDAVLPAEFVETREAGLGAPHDRMVGRCIADVSPGKNIGRRGEDIVRGTTLLDAGRVLRPQDLGVMSSIGLADATVVRQPRVRLVITGNELLPSGSAPHGFQITDANGPMLAALAERDGAIVDFPGLVRDEPTRSCAGPARRRRRRHRLRRLERRHRGPRADAGGRARRAGRARHRDAAEQPDRHGPHRTAAGLPAAGQSRVGALRLRLLRRPRDPRARRPIEGLAVPLRARHACAQDQLADRPPGLRARRVSRTAAWSRCRCPARRCSRPRPAPTAS